MTNTVVYLREQQWYSFADLKAKFEDDVENVIETLLKNGVLKQVRTTAERDLSELAEETFALGPVEQADVSKSYTFCFVGVLLVKGRLLKCLPKYETLPTDTTDKTVIRAIERRLQTIFSVLRKYNRNADREFVYLYNDNIDGSAFNFLAVMLYLLQDYHENGLYNNDKEIVETNGSGEILWDKTINSTFALLQEGRPYYMELQTRRRMSDENDYFRRLHQCVLSNCTKELQEKGIIDLFGLTSTEKTSETLDDFGGVDYICYRIEQELNMQFNTRKKLLLKTMYAYIRNENSVKTEDRFSMFGTNSFHVIWEEVCRKVLNDKLTCPYALGVLQQEKGGCPSMEEGFPKHLLDYIEKPKWMLDGKEDRISRDTLIPDIVTFSKNEKWFAIFDAKYYYVREVNGQLAGVPGIESVTKQYLYELAYQNIIPEGWTINNAFLFPYLDETGDEWATLFRIRGEVHLAMLENYYELKPIKIVFVDPQKLYEKYLEEEAIDVHEIKAVLNQEM